MKFDMGKDQYRFLTLLILGDMGFIFLHILYTYTGLLSNDLFSIELDRGYGEMFQYIKEFSIVMLLLFLSKRRSRFLYFCWALLFFYLLADDSFQLHERLGSSIVNYLGMHPKYDIRGIRAQDFGELSVSIFFGTIFIPLIAITHYRSDVVTREISKYLFVMLA